MFGACRDKKSGQNPHNRGNNCAANCTAVIRIRDMGMRLRPVGYTDGCRDMPGHPHLQKWAIRGAPRPALIFDPADSRTWGWEPASLRLFTSLAVLAALACLATHLPAGVLLAPLVVLAEDWACEGGAVMRLRVWALATCLSRVAVRALARLRAVAGLAALLAGLAAACVPTGLGQVTTRTLPRRPRAGPHRLTVVTLVAAPHAPTRAGVRAAA